MKKAAKILRRLCAFVFAAFLIPILILIPGCQKADGNNETYSLYIYMSGGDLESGAGSASRVIEDMLRCKKTSNVEIYILAGGANKWHYSGIDADSVSLYKLADGKLRNIENYGACNMGDKATLRRFIEFSAASKTDKRILMFWGHGSPYGLCVDEKHGNDSLTYKEVEEALADEFYDLLIFNACYTANLDLMAFMSDNAAYAIASEDAFPSLGFDYRSMIEVLVKNCKKPVKDIASGIIDACKNKYKNSNIGKCLTLSLIDLNKFREMLEPFEDYFVSIYYNANEWFQSAAKSNKISEKGIDLADIIDHHSKESALDEFFKECLVYETHGEVYDISGLYLFYKDKLTTSDLALYSKNCWFSDYYYFLNNKKMVENGEYVKFIESLPDEKYLCNCTVNKTATMYSSLYSYVIDDTENDVRIEDVLGAGCKDMTKNNMIYVEKEALFELKFMDELITYNFFSYQEDDEDSVRAIYSAPVMLNGKGGRIFFSYTFEPEKKYDGSYKILCFIEDCDEEEGAFAEELKDGDTVTINGREQVYSSQSIERVPAAGSVGISIKVYDIYGNVYVYSDGR